MEAKDTVIKISDCPYQPDGCKDELWVDLGAVYQEKFMQGARRQAEISFKAGIKEVVEWIDENGIEGVEETGEGFNLDKPQLVVDKKPWQAKLKEWGIGS